MKTTALGTRSVLGVSVMAATLTFSASADQATPTPNTGTKTEVKVEHRYTGRVATVEPQDHVLKVKGLLLSKSFNLGDSCQYTFLDQRAGSVSDLHPGQKVTVGYQNAQGVLVADRVEQRPLRYEGAVKKVDPNTHQLTVRRSLIAKTFRIGDDCPVVLHGGKTGTLADVQPGEHVTVTYEVPAGHATARGIEQTSAKFTGSLTAIDLNTRTVQAKSLTGSKKFNLADPCAIVLNGQPGGRMLDLKPGDKLTFSYDDVNGVNVANRIATAGASAESVTAQSK